MSEFPFNNNDPRAWTGRDGRVGVRGAAQGENHRNAKLTEAQAREIKYTPAYGEGGVSHVEMAKRMGCSDTTVTDIRNGKRWRHLAREEEQ